MNPNILVSKICIFIFSHSVYFARVDDATWRPVILDLPYVLKYKLISDSLHLTGIDLNSKSHQYRTYCD